MVNFFHKNEVFRSCLHIVLPIVSEGNMDWDERSKWADRICEQGNRNREIEQQQAYHQHQLFQQQLETRRIIHEMKQEAERQKNEGKQSDSTSKKDKAYGCGCLIIIGIITLLYIMYH